MQYAKSFARLAATVALATGFAATGNLNAFAADPIDIGIVDSLTGTVAIAGTADVCGARIAAEAINEAGGVDGQTIELHVFDNQSNPAFAAQGASNLTDEGIKFFVGGSTSATVLSTLPIIKDAGGLHAGGTTKAQEILNSGAWVFRLNSDNSQDGKSIADYLKDVVKAKHVAFAAVQGAYGEGALASIKAGLPADVEIKPYFAPTDATNFQSIITSITADKPDAVVFAIAGNAQPVAFIRQAKQAGISVPILAGAGVLTQSVAQSAGGQADGVISSDLWLAEVDTPANQKLKADYDKYRAKFTECSDKPLDKQVAVTYSQLLLIADAIKSAKSTDPETVYKAVMGGEWDLPQGKVKFREDGQALIHSYMIVGKGGSVSPLSQ